MPRLGSERGARSRRERDKLNVRSTTEATMLRRYDTAHSKLKEDLDQRIGWPAARFPDEDRKHARSRRSRSKPGGPATGAERLRARLWLAERGPDGAGPAWGRKHNGDKLVRAAASWPGRWTSLIRAMLSFNTVSESGTLGHPNGRAWGQARAPDAKAPEAPSAPLRAPYPLLMLPADRPSADSASSYPRHNSTQRAPSLGGRRCSSQTGNCCGCATEPPILAYRLQYGQVELKS